MAVRSSHSGMPHEIVISAYSRASMAHRLGGPATETEVSGDNSQRPASHRLTADSKASTNDSVSAIRDSIS